MNPSALCPLSRVWAPPLPACLSTRRGGSCAIDDFYLAVGRDQQGSSHADEKAVLDHARHGGDGGGKLGRVLDGTEGAVINHIAAVGLERAAVALAQGQGHIGIAG